MAYKQPRVPEFNEREGTVGHLKALTAFLKDFCMAAWKADTQREKEIGSVSYPVTSVNGETGDVVLSAEDVGARADTWTPSAQDVGALPADGTAADSGKLGGKAPEYYIQPRNLLDNSDFTQPVNQRNVVSGSTSKSSTYFFDRWMTYQGIINNMTYAFDDAGLQVMSIASVGGAYGIQQRLEPALTTGKVYTLAAEVDGVKCAITITGGNGSVQTVDYISATMSYVLDYGGYNTVRIYWGDGSSHKIRWMALYEGEYTADTLPPYVPKGYAAELAACNAASVDLGGGYGGGSLQAYPVGSVYISTSTTSPAGLFGGTWEMLKNRFLIGAGGSYANGGTGGKTGYALRAAIGAINGDPSHIGYCYTSAMTYQTNATSARYGLDASSEDISKWNHSTIVTEQTGTSSTTTIIPPYLAVCMWERIA